MDFGRMLLYGAIRAIPLATGFGVWGMAKDKGIGTLGSAVAASGTAVLTGGLAMWLEREVAEDEILDTVEANLGPEAAAEFEAQLNSSGLTGLPPNRSWGSPQYTPAVTARRYG